MNTPIHKARRRLNPADLAHLDHEEEQRQVRGLRNVVGAIALGAALLAGLSYCQPTHAMTDEEREQRADARQREADLQADLRANRAVAEAERRADERQRSAEYNREMRHILKLDQDEPRRRY